jgi:hypothetical protein
MISRPRLAVRVTPALLCMGVACTNRPEAADQSATRVPTAEAIVGTYLEHARLGVSEVEPESLFACHPAGPTDKLLAPARGRVISSALRGDTALVRAQVLSVATVELAPDGPYDVRQGLRTDTLSWGLIRRPGGGQWGLCGYSREGFDFVRLAKLGTTGRWLGGASLASVTRLADSVARAP